MTQRRTNRWKGFVLGGFGGVAGVLAMRYYWKGAKAITGRDPRTVQKENQEPQPLDDISLVGKQHKEGESSTDAMGRIIYQSITGREPGDETKLALSYVIHWIVSMFASGAYGALRGPAYVPDFEGGTTLGVGLWLFGDELAMPALGLTKGPTAYPAELHAHALGAHIAYGLASSAVTQLLQAIF
jgi:hypothetical protein